MQDTGVGIGQLDQQKLFKLFGSIDHSTHLNKNGIGLGLYISKNIVKHFGGEIYCKSVIDEGTSFIFYIPLESFKESNQQNLRLKNPI